MLILPCLSPAAVHAACRVDRSRLVHAASFHDSRSLTGGPRLTEKKHKRDHDEHGEHQDLELADDRDGGGLVGDHAVERGKARLRDRTCDIRGDAVGREVLGERDVHAWVLA